MSVEQRPPPQSTAGNLSAVMSAIAEDDTASVEDIAVAVAEDDAVTAKDDEFTPRRIAGNLQVGFFLIYFCFFMLIVLVYVFFICPFPCPAPAPPEN